MSGSESALIHGSVVEEQITLSLTDLSHACRVDTELLVTLVHEGVLEPAGGEPPEWRFSGPALRRARAALRLVQELQLEPHAVAVVLDLLDQIDSLESRLRRLGQR